MRRGVGGYEPGLSREGSSGPADNLSQTPVICPAPKPWSLRHPRSSLAPHTWSPPHPLSSLLCPYLDDDDAFLHHVVDLGLDQLEKHVDALLGSALNAHSAATDSPDCLQEGG